VAEVPAALTGLGVTHALVVTGRTTSRADAVRAALATAGIATTVRAVPGEPTVDLVRSAVTAAREAGCDGVLGFGGGSAVDVAKAVAILAPDGAAPLDHLEVIGGARPFTRPGLPCVAVPTTAGTGSEVTRNAVLTGEGVKASLRSSLMLPRVAVVDPDLLVGLPAATIVAGGLDALTQLIEPFLSRRAQPVTDAQAREGLRRSARSLRRAARPGPTSGTSLDDDQALREDLALASLFGGVCLANAGLGVVHGFAAPIGGRFDAPHGAVCAAVLGLALDVTFRVIAERAPGPLPSPAARSSPSCSPASRARPPTRSPGWPTCARRSTCRA
jgi:alcohol dehydrogenase class IV